MNEKDVKNEVCDYLTGRLFRDFSVHLDDNEPDLCAIHFGRTRNGTADVVLCNKEKYFVAIAECKSPSIGITDAGRNQLKSYLSSTGTRFGILAASANSNEWIYAENLGGNKFRQIEKSYFEEHVFDPPIIEWTQGNVLKWKSAAEAFQSTAEEWKSAAEENQSTTEAFQSTAEENQSAAEEWKSTATRCKIFIWILGVAILLLIFFLIRDGVKSPSRDSADKGDLYQVSRIIDGDTVEIEYEGVPTSVQLIGVNAPETVHPSIPPERYGREATEFIQYLLLHKFVYFDFDGDKKDKYDRLLAYVYRDSDNLFVNVEIIRQGYGQTDARFPFKYMDLFKYHESQARRERKMMWSR